MPPIAYLGEPGSVAVTILTVCLTALGCSSARARLPNEVTDDEYAVYAACIRHDFKAQPSRLLLAEQTFIFDPLARCSSAELRAKGVSTALRAALHDLGQAEFPVDTDKFRYLPFKIPWTYETSLRWPPDESRPYRLVSFSRVAFNRKKTEGLFAVNDACGGLCGGGGALIATLRNGEWQFKPAGCFWIS